MALVIVVSLTRMILISSESAVNKLPVGRTGIGRLRVWLVTSNRMNVLSGNRLRRVNDMSDLEKLQLAIDLEARAAWARALVCRCCPQVSKNCPRDWPRLSLKYGQCGTDCPRASSQSGRAGSFTVITTPANIQRHKPA